MDLNLTDKVVIITGGSKGIGAGCVEVFAAEGAIPVIVGRSPQVGIDLLATCGEAGAKEPCSKQNSHQKKLAKMPSKPR